MKQGNDSTGRLEEKETHDGYKESLREYYRPNGWDCALGRKRVCAANDSMNAWGYVSMSSDELAADCASTDGTLDNKLTILIPRQSQAWRPALAVA